MTILFRYKIGNLQIFLFVVLLMETRNRNKKTSAPLVLEPVDSNAPKVKNKRGRPAKADDDKQTKSHQPHRCLIWKEALVTINRKLH